MNPSTNDNLIIDILQRALQHHQSGQLAEAEKLYLDVLAARPDHPDALNLLGMLEHQRGNHDRAIDLISKAVQHHPAAPILCNLGLVLLAQDRHEPALDSFRRAIDADPSYITSYTNMGSALRALGRNDEAVAYLQKALSLAPRRDDILVTLDMITQEKQIRDAMACHVRNKGAGTSSAGHDMLEPLSFQGLSYNVADKAKFAQGLDLIRESLADKGASLFASDNVITWNRSYSFLRDEFFLRILDAPGHSYAERSVIWRTYVLLHFAKYASKVAGDYLELGCHTGHTAAQVISRIDFKSLAKSYFLYDLFEWKEGDEHTRMHGHQNPRMYEDVVKRFAGHDFVRVIKGYVPQSFADGFPETVAFAHIDMNHPIPEAGALERIIPRLSRGGVIVLDDYGWWGYSRQKMALDPIIERNGLSVLELPTGQGIILNP